MNRPWRPEIPKRIAGAALLALLSPILAACGGGGSDDELVVYSGRSEELVAPLIERFEKSSGKTVEVRYGNSAELAATLLEEGDNTPADVFFSQDAGALGALQKANLLAPLPRAVLNRVDPKWRSPQGRWVGTSGRARIVAYDKREVRANELPPTIDGFTDPRWKGKLGWAPTNASFQAFVTAMRRLRGDAATERWLKGVVANDPERFEDNEPLRDAIAQGEVEVGFLNHYYVARAIAENGPGYPVGVHFTKGGDPGSLVNVAGVAILKGSQDDAGAKEFVEYLLSRPAQAYFARETKEYPLTAGVRPDPSLVPLASIQSPRLDLSDLDDVQGTERLIRRSGAL
ncbi:MAG TPA: iron ABC transporter substrate-binding protein [Solirubrobacteraceae bacterium]|nr:iron ABC transporter substrate-binding protein [Solirubrobacteraceae bacterium]